MTDVDEQYLNAYNKAMAEHLKNPVVYSQEEVCKIIDNQLLEEKKDTVN